MSNKTIKHRIAAIAIAALGTGLLAVVPVSTATAATPTASTLKVAAALSGAANLETSADDDTPNGSSSGLLSIGTGTATTQTAVLLSTGEIVVTAGAGASNLSNTSLVVTGGTIKKAYFSGATLAYISSDLSTTMNYSTAATPVSSAGGVNSIAAQIAPKSGVTSMTIDYYVGTGIAPATPTTGTLTGRVVVTVASADSRYAYASTYSFVNTSAITTSGTNTGAAASATVDGVDQTGASTPANGDYGYMNFTLKDAFATALDSIGAVTIEATNGGLVKFNTTLGTASIPTASLDVTTDASGTVTVARPAASANKAFNTTVTVKYNGVSVGSKSFSFVGEVATMSVTKPTVSRTGASNADAFRVTYADNAGNALYPSTGWASVATSLNGTVTALTIPTPGVAATATAAKGTVVCSGTAGSYADSGSADVQMEFQNAGSGSIIKSNVWKHYCAGDAYTYVASFDKASYTPGSIAKLNVTFKDRGGALANSVTSIGTTAVGLITVTGGPSATYVTAPADADKPGIRDADADGVKSYQFVVGSTEGDYVAVVSAPVVKAANSSAGNQSLPYSIKLGTAAVSNADVLKSIVALIASINKQIQALQKLILKR
jgi:hypothetical protein